MSLESAEQLRDVRDLIARVFSPPELERLVYDCLGVRLARLVAPGTHDQQVFELLQACEARGWLERLLDGVASERPQSKDVALLMQRLGRGGGAVPAAAGRRTVSAVGTASPDAAAHILSNHRDEELQASITQLDDAHARTNDLKEIGEPTVSGAIPARGVHVDAGSPTPQRPREPIPRAHRVTGAASSPSRPNIDGADKIAAYRADIVRRFERFKPLGANETVELESIYVDLAIYAQFRSPFYRTRDELMKEIEHRSHTLLENARAHAVSVSKIFSRELSSQDDSQRAARWHGEFFDKMRALDGPTALAKLLAETVARSVAHDVVEKWRSHPAPGDPGTRQEQLQQLLHGEIVNQLASASLQVTTMTPLVVEAFRTRLADAIMRYEQQRKRILFPAAVNDHRRIVVDGASRLWQVNLAAARVSGPRQATA